MKKARQLTHWPKNRSSTRVLSAMRSGAFGLTRGNPFLTLTSPPERGPFICPKCDSFMERVVMSGIPVERCEGCLGIFFDDGEVDELLGRAAPHA